MNPYTKTLERVWRNTQYIRVNEDKLCQLIKGAKSKHLPIPAWDDYPVQPKTDCSLSEWVNFVCWINAINFAFTNFDPPFSKFTAEGVHRRGTLAMRACFLRALEEGIPVFDANYMKDISLMDAAHIFRAADDDHQIPMLFERQVIFHDVAEALLKQYDGNWLNLFRVSDWHAFGGLGIVDRLVGHFRSFCDSRHYRRHTLYFHERAQLLVMMYQGRALNSAGRFPLLKDADEIGPIAGYEVPKALKYLGVLEYAPLVERLIQEHFIFKSGHVYEVESRLAMSYAMARICQEAGVNMAQADYFIWNMGRQSEEPHMLVPTTDY